jgi:hypothetical protein
MSEKLPGPDEWLIRTHDNQIYGPYTGEVIKNLILDGSLKIEDEVSPANGYWIYLREKEELMKWLEVEVPLDRRGVRNEETDTTLLREKTPTPAPRMEIERRATATLGDETRAEVPQSEAIKRFQPVASRVRKLSPEESSAQVLHVQAVRTETSVAFKAAIWILSTIIFAVILFLVHAFRANA